MEFQQLRYFVRIAEDGSFTRAAEALLVAQPSLSQQIRKLERELGFQLFERNPARVRLTREGQQFLPYARAVLSKLAEAATVAAELRGSERGEVTIGVSPIAGARILPGLLRAVTRRFPGLTIRTREEGLSRLLKLLEDGAIDLATVLLPNTEPNLVVTTVLADYLVLVLPTGHRLAGYDVVSIEETRDEPFVLLTAEFGLRQRVIEECERAGFRPRVVFESREVWIIQRLVEAGLGVTVLPVSAVRHDLATVVRPVLSGGVQPRREIGLAMRGDRYVPIAARQVFELAREVRAEEWRA